MGTHFSICLPLAFACLFSSLYAEVSRKELRIKEGGQESTIQSGYSIKSYGIDPSKVIELSWKPRAFLYKGFLSDEECDHLISLAIGKNNSFFDSGHAVKEIGVNKDEMAARIEGRISAWTFLPRENGQPLKVKHFSLEDAQQKYSYFGINPAMKLDEPLAATVIMYLSNVTQGGQLLFPEAESKTSAPKSKIWSHCTKSSYTQRPTKGNAILFFNLHLDRTLDKSSSHARCPILEGEMWCAMKFLHVKALHREKVVQTNDNDCTDEHEDCPRWAATGECDKNPVFMIGSPDYYGTCRKSCDAC